MNHQIGDQKDKCHRDPPAFFGVEELARIGVEYFHVRYVNTNLFPGGTKLYWTPDSLFMLIIHQQIPISAEHSGLAAIAGPRGYNYRDEIVISPGRLADYELRIRQFFEEHLHTDEEIRYIREGAGYFDVRSEDVRKGQ